MGTEMEQTAMQELLIQQVIEIAESNVNVDIIDDPFVPQGSVNPGQVTLTPVKRKRSVKEYKRVCKPKLVDALGYVYNVKRVRAHGVTDWQCTARGKNISCRAGVKQKKGGFNPGPQPHIHMAESLIDTIDASEGKDAKSKTKKRPRKPAKLTKGMLSSMKAELPDTKSRKSKKLAKLQNIVNYQKPRLVDNRNGFTYSIKRVRNEVTSWKCILRDSALKCPAVLRQRKEQFALGSKPHNHEGGIQVERVPKLQESHNPKRRKKKSIAEQAWDIVNEGNALKPEPSAVLPAIEPQTPRLSEEAQAAGYRFLEASSQRCRPRLVDSQGFMYNVKRVRGDTVDWQCTVRNKKMRCPVYLKECDGVIKPGPHQHTHTPEPGAVAKSVVKAAIKARAVENFTEPTKEIVNQVLTQQVMEEPTVAILSPINLARMAYRAREVKKKMYFNDVLSGLARFHPDGVGSWVMGDSDSDNTSSSDEDQ